MHVRVKTDNWKATLSVFKTRENQKKVCLKSWLRLLLHCQKASRAAASLVSPLDVLVSNRRKYEIITCNRDTTSDNEQAMSKAKIFTELSELAVLSGFVGSGKTSQGRR